MTDRTEVHNAEMSRDPSFIESRKHRVNLYVGLVAISAAFLCGLVATIEILDPPTGVDWWACLFFGALLFVGEVRPGAWLRFGAGSEVTPGSAFAFALVLLGSPTAAVVTMAVATLIADRVQRKPIVMVVFNAASLSAGLAIGALVLRTCGVSGPLLSDGRISVVASIGAVLGGLAVLMTNNLLLYGVMSISRGIPMPKLLAYSFSRETYADGALLALAPIFVVTVQFSLLLVPLLGITSFLVFQSASQAAERAHEVDHDPLTDLLNRKAFVELLETIMSTDQARTSPSATVLLIDLDGFKEINDRLGHETGDSLLVGLASRMKNAIPATASAARIGGDEFAIVIDETNSDGLRGEQLARDLRKRLSRTLDVGGFPLAINMSVGVALAPLHGSTPEELLGCADIAMYRAKHFRTGVEVYSNGGKSSRNHGRLGLLGDLSAAIENGELNVHYQPQVRMADGEVEAMEALLRWQHPTLGAIPPGDFIALAEHTELIGPLTAFVIDQAIGDLIRLDRPRMKVAVNVSARNLQDRHFPLAVLESLRRAELDPHRLELEITESAIASEPERASYAIETLRNAGIRVAIDDFGTGYSSFVSLRDLRVDRLKIDRTFIADLTTSAHNEVIVRTMIAMGRDLGLETVAEGIEDMATWDMLHQLGCEVAQGYLIARPCAFAELQTWLGERVPHHDAAGDRSVHALVRAAS